MLVATLLSNSTSFGQIPSTIITIDVEISQAWFLIHSQMVKNYLFYSAGQSIYFLFQDPFMTGQETDINDRIKSNNVCDLAMLEL